MWNTTNIALIDLFPEWPPQDDFGLSHMLKQTCFNLQIIGNHQYSGNLEGVYIPYTLQALADFVSSLDITLIAGRGSLNGMSFEDILSHVSMTRSQIGVMGLYPNHFCLTQSTMNSNAAAIGCCQPVEISKSKRSNSIIMIGDLSDKSITAASEACKQLKRPLALIGDQRFIVAPEALIYGKIPYSKRIELLSQASLCLVIETSDRSFDESILIEPLACGTPVCAIEMDGVTVLDNYYVDGVTGRLWKAKTLTAELIRRAISTLPSVDSHLLQKLVEDLYSPDVYLQRVVDSLG